MKKENFKTTGKIAHFYNEKVFVFIDDNGKEYEVISTEPVNTSINTEVEMTGYIENGQHYVENINPKPNSDFGAIEFLKKLFTKKQSDAIVSFFGSATYAVELINNNWLQFEKEVSEVKGIGPKTIKKAFDKLSNEQLSPGIVTYLTPLDFSFEEKLLVSQFLAGSPLTVLSTNPYQLYQLGVSFKSVDRLAIEFFKMEETHPLRIKTAIVSILDNAANMGHLFLYLEKPNHRELNNLTLYGELERVLGLGDKKHLYSENIKMLQSEFVIVVDTLEGAMIVYGIDYYNQEVLLSKSLYKFIKPIHNNKDDVEKAIKKFEKNNFKLHKLQRDAIELSINNQCSILTGPPGSGKTTIIEAIIQTYQTMNPDSEIACAAPTGKAAERMTETIESTGLQASTIHRMLKPRVMDGKSVFFHNKNNKLDYDFIVVDEISMVDYHLMQSLLDACKDDAKLLFVGDEHQLSSVSPGSLLLEMLNSNVIPKTILTKIFRQSGESSILSKSKEIRSQGTMSLKEHDDFRFDNIDNVENVQRKLVSFAMSQKFRNNIKDWTILTGLNKGPLGVDTINQIIQEAYNPYSPQVAEVPYPKGVLRVGDKVLQLVNDDSLGIVNGSIGRIRTITMDYLYIDFIEGEDWVEVPLSKVENIQLAYAMTIHKSQGSEYKEVCSIFPTLHSSFLNRPLIYTAITRAKDYLYVIGNEDTILRALNDEASLIQYSALSKRLQIENASSKI